MHYVKVSTLGMIGRGGGVFIRTKVSSNACGNPLILPLDFEQSDIPTETRLRNRRSFYIHIMCVTDIIPLRENAYCSRGGHGDGI